MISKHAEETLFHVKSYNKRILIVHFSGNPVGTIIVNYAPIAGNVEAEEHYSNLATAISTIPKHNLLLVIGNCNAHLGPTDVQYTYHRRHK